MTKSYAPNIELESDQDISFDNGKGIQQPFAEAHRDYVNLELESEADEVKGKGSSMIQDDSFDHDMHPPSEIREEVDRADFETRWEDLQQEEQAEIEAQAAEALELEAEMDLGDDNELSM